MALPQAPTPKLIQYLHPKDDCRAKQAHKPRAQKHQDKPKNQKRWQGGHQ
jgi:hypothetical protein